MARHRLAVFQPPSRRPDRNPVDIERLAPERYRFFDYDYDYDNDNDNGDGAKGSS